MHRINAGKTKKIISVSLAGILAASVLGVGLYNNPVESMARPSLPGVEGIVMANSKEKPFTILEIVPDYSMARIGYTIAGEEPGDVETAKSIMDMASEGERTDYYMNGIHTTKETVPFVDLSEKAFKYEQYYEKFDEEHNIIDKDYEGRKSGATYGEFFESSSPALYEAAAANELYGYLGDEDNLSLQDIVDEHEITSGEGKLYMDYVSFTQSIGGSYNLVFSPINTDNEWKNPFWAMENEGIDYFCKTHYAIGTEFKSSLEQNDIEDEEDDTYVLNLDIPAGTVLYTIPDGFNTISYYGYVVADAEGKLSFTKNGEDFIPISGLVTEESLAREMYEEIEINLHNSRFVTVRTEGSDDATNDLYYVSSVETATPGSYSAEFYSKQPVNDPSYSMDVFGIYDENNSQGYWYHKWFYKKAKKAPYDYVGAEMGSYDFKYIPSADLANEYYYLGGYTNYEWFKREVLDVDEEKLGDIVIDVKTKRLEEVTESDIFNCDLVYFTGLYNGKDNGEDVYVRYAGDMQKEAAVALIRSVDDQSNKPVILNASSYLKDAIIDDEHPILKTVLSILMSDDISNAGSYVDENNDFVISEALAKIYADQQRIYESRSSLKEDSSHVVGSVFVNDDIVVNDAIYSDFTIGYSSGKISGFALGNVTLGFSLVEKDIAREAFYLDVAEKNKDNFVQTVSKATSIRYILNYGNRRIVGKNAINVLDIEPYYNRDVESQNAYEKALKKLYTYDDNNNRIDVEISNYASLTRDIFDADWFHDNVSDSTDADKIGITGIGTKEFIGKIEDLSENYDLIYIGLDTAYMPTKITKEGEGDNATYTKTDEVVSNSIGSLIYKRTGDTIKTSGMDGTNNTYTMSGNDITPDKLRELEEFVEAGYAVILSDKFFNYFPEEAVDDDGNKLGGKIKEINKDLVDEDSYMYAFVKWCIDNDKIGNNVGVKKDFDRTDKSSTTTGLTRAENCAKFVEHLNISKLEVEVIDHPPYYNTYDRNPAHNYLSMNNDGVYTLDFTVRLSNNAAAGLNENDYNCDLYIDIDGDGRFEPIEKQQNDTMYITNIDTNTSMDVDSDGRFHLTTGARYSISKRVPDGYVGLVSWKLVFSENGRTITRVVGGEEVTIDLIRVAIQDFSAISDRLNRPKIKVLQLVSGDAGTGKANRPLNFDLKTDKDLIGYEDNNGENVPGLYDQVTDFEISKDTITQYKVSDFISGNIDGFKNHLDTLMQYDMVVLGFTDVFLFNADDAAAAENAVLAIRQYMLSGRSILFTHDLTSTHMVSNTNTWTYSTNSNDWGYYANKYLRDIQGMDRYGTVQGDSDLVGKKVNGQNLLPYVSVYDTKGAPANDDKNGFCDAALMRYTDGSVKYGELAPTGTRQLGDGERVLTSVSRVNRGQITEYPFRIGGIDESDGTANENISVAATHHQYFQLDMETDYTDTNYDDDIVVWYTISSGADANDNYHKLNYNDVRNNYYIYTKGNVTYTGAGHSAINGKEEKKLFVNTLVAAYNAGVHAPYVSYRSNDTERAQNITSMYVPYDLTFANTDTEIGVGDGWISGASNEKVTIYFATVNNNLKDSMLPLNTQYYVEVPAGSKTENSTDIIEIGGKWYKIITPTLVQDCGLKTDLNNEGATSENDENADSGTTTKPGASYHSLTSGKIYKAEFNVSDLMAGQTVRERHSAVVNIRLSNSTSLADMSKDEVVLPGTDSMKPLTINFTELYDLK